MIISTLSMKNKVIGVFVLDDWGFKMSSLNAEGANIFDGRKN